jgi:hypothetical protein
VGNGANTLFWSDTWLQVKAIADLAPNLIACISKRIINKRQCSRRLCFTTNRFRILEFLYVLMPGRGTWIYGTLFSRFVLQPDLQDEHCWRFFLDTVCFAPWKLIWKTWAPIRHRWFFIWLAVHKCCWTADGLACRGLPPPATCLLCHQENEAINPTLASCVFSCQVWFVEGWFTRRLTSEL